MLPLQRFVTEVIEALGGIVEPVEYALCQVLIPENYQSYFQGKSELTLAFDFEVAQENPEAEFVTFGSYTLEQVRTLAGQTAVSTLRFAEVHRIAPGNSTQKIRDVLDTRGKIEIASERPIMGIWALFQFQVAYVSDEKYEEPEQVWVDLLTGNVSSAMKNHQNEIIYEKEPLYPYPIPATPDFSCALKEAFQQIHREAENHKQEWIHNIQLEKDLQRIQTYYEELAAENEKRANRANLSTDKLQDIHDKTDSIQLEKEKQVTEIKDKYNIDVEVTLDHGILYFIPEYEYDIRIDFRGSEKQQTLHYNSITKSFTLLKEPAKEPVT